MHTITMRVYFDKYISEIAFTMGKQSDLVGQNHKN